MGKVETINAKPRKYRLLNMFGYIIENVKHSKQLNFDELVVNIIENENCINNFNSLDYHTIFLQSFSFSLIFPTLFLANFTA